jgi:prepilin-type N-terminal cleavage/methylation domain-containing protein
MSPRRAHGFTLIEVLVAMTLTGIVVAGTLRALSAQKRFYARQARILDARHAMRASLTILSSEFREVSSVGGDLYYIASDSVGLRSNVGFGVACAVGAGVLSLVNVSGHFRTEAGDSVLVACLARYFDHDFRARVCLGDLGGAGCLRVGFAERRLGRRAGAPVSAL